MTTLEKIRAEIAKIRDSWEKDCYHDEADALALALQIIDKYAEQEPCDDIPSVRPQDQTGKCRICKYGEIYNELWCKCNDPLLNGAMVKMTDKCRAEEIIDLNRKYKAESEDKE